MYSLQELAIKKINSKGIIIGDNVPEEIREYIMYSRKVSEIDEINNLFELRKKVKKLLEEKNHIRYDVLICKYLELMNCGKKFKAMVLIDEMLKFAFVNKNANMIEKILKKCPEINKTIELLCAKRKYDEEFCKYVMYLCEK